MGGPFTAGGGGGGDCSTVDTLNSRFIVSMVVQTVPRGTIYSAMDGPTQGGPYVVARTVPPRGGTIYSAMDGPTRGGGGDYT